MLKLKAIWLRKRLRKMLARRSVADDFNWNTYSAEYQEQLEECAQSQTQILTVGDYLYRDGRLEMERDMPPLHPNHQLLYETILQLHPSSVMEIGCGSGDHLYNLALLDPDINLHGVDRSAGQVELLHRRHPGITAHVATMDATVVQDAECVCDLVFTHAVIMHIQTRKRHLTALENLFKCARRQVILMENWTRHPFMKDIRGLREDGRIAWADLHFYYGVSAMDAATRIMVISAVPLAGHQRLSDYDTLLDGSAPD